MKFYQAHQYQGKCERLFNLYSQRIKSVLPGTQIEHIGASSIPQCVSKGDLDIYVAVDSTQHQMSIALIEKIGFNIKQDTLRTQNLCMLESDNNDDVAIQLVAKNSEFEFFLTFRDKLLKDPNLVESYNQMKLSCVGMTQEKYREIKSKFIKAVI